MTCALHPSPAASAEDRSPPPTFPAAERRRSGGKKAAASGGGGIWANDWKQGGGASRSVNVESTKVDAWAPMVERPMNRCRLHGRSP
nr:hypothetical protein CFP56_79051 [Quercus suber]